MSLVTILVVTAFTLLDKVPIAFATYLGGIGVYSFSLPSTILMEIPTLAVVSHRIGLAILANVFVFAAGCLLKRSRRKISSVYANCCFLAAVVGVSVVCYPIVLESLNQQQHRNWADAHKVNNSIFPGDLLKIEGQVVIDPGKRLFLDITMQLQLPESDISDEILFSFNPGMQIKALSVDGRETAFEFERGLLAVKKQLTEDTPDVLLICLKAEGIPDARFAYLDQAISFQHDWNVGSTLTRGLGHQSSLFHRKYVALMPSTKWLPSLGVAVHEDLTERQPKDFFNIDLSVTVPNSWSIAAPHKSIVNSDRDFRHYKVSSEIPLTEVVLIAAEFARRGLDVEGVNMELLLHKKHEHKLDFLSEYVSEIENSLEKLFRELEANGLPYPLTELTLVEIPTSLRTYGGGWEMGSVLSAPGIVMMRELSLPTVKMRQYLDRSLLHIDETQRPPIVVGSLGSFFSHDQFGGDIFREGARNLIQNWTKATGLGANAIECIVNELAFQSLTVERYIAHQAPAPSFSAYNVRNSKVQGFVQKQLLVPSRYRLIDEYSDLATQIFEDSPDSWQDLQTSLASLDFKKNPEAASKILRMKCTGIAGMLYHSLGRSAITDFLGKMRTQFQCGSYSLQEIEQISKDLGVSELAHLVDWVTKPELPGFLVRAESVSRVSAQQRSGYFETSILVRNDENISGAVSLNLARGESGIHFFTNNSPPKTYFIPAKTTYRIRLASSFLPSAVRINTFLSLNQGSLTVLLPSIVESGQVDQIKTEIEIVNDEWESLTSIVVDDLDDHFTLHASKNREDSAILDFFSSIRQRQGTTDDIGLPRYIENDPLPPIWSRVKLEGAFGKYRRTAAIGVPAFGEIRASFGSSLTEAGKWQLDFHMPVNPQVVRLLNRGFQNWITSSRLPRTMYKQGVYDIRIVKSDEIVEFEFDASEGILGWNRLGTYPMDASYVEVQVSNRTDGAVVYADAIRWTKESN
ncbi:MAG: hypothetical protein OXG24_06080 [Gammaproteobacteria bacterium]|nr:hypothetical protein [Gammaproteobacteria bacterium]